MSEAFYKFHKKFLRNAIVAGAVAGVCTGLVLTGVLLLSFKLSGVDLAVWVYILAGLASALLCGGLVFVALFPTKKKTAKRLDRQFSLGEKIQTMVEFDGQEGEMVALQREDAAERLVRAPRMRVKPLAVCTVALACVLSCSLFFTGVFLPAVGESGPTQDPDDVFEITAWEVGALQQLIKEVEGSDLEEDLKQPIGVSLGALLEVLQQTNSASEMKTQVRAAVRLIDSLIDDAVSYSEIAVGLRNYEVSKKLGDVISQAVTSYKVGDSKIGDLAQIKQVMSDLDVKIEETVTVYFTEVEEELSKLTGYKAFTDRVKVYSAAFRGAAGEVAVAEGDALFAAVTAYRDALVAVETSSTGREAMFDMIVADDKTFVASATDALVTQSYKLMMKEYIRNELAAIFDIALTDPSEDQGGGSDTEIPDEGNQDGGYGKGETIYGSDDTIFDPDSEQHIKYGEKINEYYGRALELMKNMTEEQRQYLSEYFDLLFGSRS